jgi:cell division protein FtsL
VTRTVQKVGARDDGWRWLWAGVVVYVGIALTGVAIAAVSQGTRNLVMALEQSQRAEDELLARQSRLLLERSMLSSLQNVDEVAERRLSMQFPELIEKVERWVPQR